MCISLHMSAEGDNAWPSQDTIAKRALVSRRSVVKHLEIAERQGWIQRYCAGLTKQHWRRDGYTAVVPDDVYNTLPEKPWEADPQWRRGEARSPPQCAEGSEPAAQPHRETLRGTPEGGESRASKVVNGATKGGESGAKGGEPGSHKSSLLNLPSETIPKSECALARTALAKPLPERNQEAIRDRIRKAIRMAPTADDASIRVMVQGATIEEVQRERRSL